MQLTVEELQGMLPDHLKTAATQELADTLNQLVTDPDTAAAIRENFVTYGMVLKEGKFKAEDYFRAVTYVSFKIMGFSNKDAYIRTFPDRYQAMLARGATDKDVSAYVSSYNSNKLVNLIYERTIIPTHVLFQDVFHKAIGEQVKIMTTAKSEMVRMQAANSLITALKQPEKKEIALTVENPGGTGIDALKNMLIEVAERQRELIEQGASTKEIAHQKLFVRNGEMIDVTPTEDI